MNDHWDMIVHLYPRLAVTTICQDVPTMGEGTIGKDCSVEDVNLFHEAVIFGLYFHDAPTGL